MSLSFSPSFSDHSEESIVTVQLEPTTAVSTFTSPVDKSHYFLCPTIDHIVSQHGSSLPTSSDDDQQSS